jgi:hypothetical protein
METKMECGDNIDYAGICFHLVYVIEMMVEGKSERWF